MRIKAWKILSPLLLIASGAFFLQNIFTWIFTLGYFLFIPGYLLLRLINPRRLHGWEMLSYSLGLSVLMIMLTGAALNVLTIFHIPAFTSLNVFLALDIVVLVLIVLSRRLSYTLHLNRKGIIRYLHTLLIYSLLAILPLLAAGGAIRLNNGGSNVLTMVLFALIAIIFLITLIKDNFRKYYPALLFVFALSILLSVSLRGWGITGHDIQREYSVFQLTMQNQNWDISGFRDPYNACLSITILPTMLARITGIPDPYVFKVVFQFIAAMAVVPIYFFVSKLRNDREGYIAGLIFLSFPAFINDMPMLNRQEIAFLYFGLIVSAMLIKANRKHLRLITMILLLGLTLSHYSSSYVMVGLMVLAWIIHKILRRLIFPKRKGYRSGALPILQVSIIIIAGVLAFVWNNQITGTTKGLDSTLNKMTSALENKSGSKAADVKYSIFAKDGATKSPQELLTSYAAPITKSLSSVTYVPERDMQLTPVGASINAYIPVSSMNALIRDSIAKLLQVLLIAGCALIGWRLWKKQNGKYDMYILSLSGAGSIMLAALTLLPQLSVDYGVLRLFQQLLFILVYPIVIALVWIVAKVTKSSRGLYVISGVFVSVIFLHTSGFLPQLTGGYKPQLSLNNNGFQYDAYYVTSGENLSSAWIASNQAKNIAVGMDSYTNLRFSSDDFDKIILTNNLEPSQNMYVYHYMPDNLFMVNINSNLYYYTLKRNNASENRIYVNQDSSVDRTRSL